MDERKPLKVPHSVIMEERKTLLVGGVSDVDSFDEQTVIVYTDLGELTVRGSDLHINKLNTDTGELSLAGRIDGMMYTDDRDKTGGFWGRLFR